MRGFRLSVFVLVVLIVSSMAGIAVAQPSRGSPDRLLEGVRAQASQPLAPALTPGGKVPVPLSGAYLGLLSQIDGLTDTQSVQQRESRFSRTFAIDSRYFDWADDFPASSQSWDVAGGRIPMITWWWPPHYSDINDGSQDSYIRARARAVKAFGWPIFLRPAAEMNGDWFDWGGANNNRDTTGFILAWRRIHDIFDAEGVRNVSWVWAPNSESSPGGWDASSWNNWRNYYPGDAYVDWVGIDGYNWGSLPGGDGWLPFGTIMNPVYSDYASQKPIMIDETGSTESGGNKAQWISDMGTWVKAHAAIKALVYFDRTYTSSGHDWGIDTSTASMTAFAKLAADPYFGVLAALPNTAPPDTAPPDTATTSVPPSTATTTSHPPGSGDSNRASRPIKVDTRVGATIFAAKVQRQGKVVRLIISLTAKQRVVARATGWVKLGRVKLKLRPQTQRVGPGKRATLTLKLIERRDGTKVLRALKHENVNATVGVTFTDALGNKARGHVVVTLR
ncbi:MAG TPA: glycosyl hydrolase [Solirubrobacteraceae bacterium]|jgi:hypothetical protein|nr:glycosyl hydrolase [Solirubrobacteraceae bacterium]